jgi:hypothetical protein
LWRVGFEGNVDPQGRWQEGERAGVMGALLEVVFDVAEPLGSWQSVENVGIACWQDFESLAELKLS